MVVPVVLVGGCGDDDGDGGPAPTRATAERTPGPTSAGPTRGPSGTGRLTGDQAERKALVGAVEIPYDEAARTAVGEVPDSRLAEIDLEGSGKGDGPGRPRWVAKVATGDGTAHIVRVDGGTGAVTGSVRDPGQDADGRRELAGRLDRAEQTPQQAARTATGRKEGTVTTVELDDEGGVLVWSVAVVTSGDWYETTFDVDAVKGGVRREDVDRD